MEPLFVSLTQLDFHSPMEVRATIPSPCHCIYDETVRVLKSAIHAAKLGREEELGALKRLDAQARLLEQEALGWRRPGD